MRSQVLERGRALGQVTAKNLAAVYRVDFFLESCGYLINGLKDRISLSIEFHLP